jgi:hypothetical protein
MEMAGHYECKAVSDLGMDKTRASLTVNSKISFLIFTFVGSLHYHYNF